MPEGWIANRFTSIFGFSVPDYPLGDYFTILLRIIMLSDHVIEIISIISEKHPITAHFVD